MAQIKRRVNATNCRTRDDAKEPLEAWHHEVLKRAWKKTPNEVKQQFRNASILKGGRAVFTIAGNKYRLVVAIDYVRQVVFVMHSVRSHVASVTQAGEVGAQEPEHTGSM